MITPKFLSVTSFIMPLTAAASLGGCLIHVVCATAPRAESSAVDNPAEHTAFAISRRASQHQHVTSGAISQHTRALLQTNITLSSRETPQPKQISAASQQRPFTDCNYL
jgi:hypothetical protein